MEKTFKVHADKIESIEAKVAKANKRVAKCGAGGLVLECLSVDLIKGENGKVTPVATMRLSGQVPVVAGYMFVGRIEHHGEIGNIVTTILEGFEMPEELRTADAICEHCNKKRKRNDTYVLQGAKGLIRVGRTCLQDFLRDDSIVHALTVIKEVSAIGSDDDIWGSSASENSYDSVITTVVAAQAAVRQWGWAPSSFENSTRSRVLDILSTPPKKSDEYAAWLKIQPNEEDIAFGKAALEWIATIPVDVDSGYLSNLRVACALGYVTDKTRGLVVSAIKAYNTHLEKEIELYKKVSKPAGQHVGKVGERLTFDQLRVERIRHNETQWGVTTIIALVDDAGNEFTWFASQAPELSTGDVVRGKGTVKKHGDFKGRPQTILTRCALQKAG